MARSGDEEFFFKAATFDPYDRGSWYFGDISREESNNILCKEHDDGVFLVRESTTHPGCLVLCVRESGKDSNVSQYIVQVKHDPENNTSSYIIGNQTFPDMPALLNFYKVHYLETSPLVRPAPRQLIKVRAIYDFQGQEEDDLPFRRGEFLWVIRKHSNVMWWLARNSVGQTGQIPANYVVQEDEEELSKLVSPSPLRPEENSNAAEAGEVTKRASQMSYQRKLPAYARVKRARIPNAYDKSALRLQVGDRIKVLKMHPSGTWEGEIDGHVGHFPFTYIEFEDDVEPGAAASSPRSS